MKKSNNTNGNFYLIILEREFNIIYDDLKNLEYNSRIDDTLLSETNDFLEDLRYQRRKLNREYSSIKSNSTKKDEEKLNQIEDQIEKLDYMESEVIGILDC